MNEKSLFGTSGIRGPADSLFTTEFCSDIAQTFVHFLKKKDLLGPIAVGMDPRESSPRIKNDLFIGLGNQDVELFDEGVTPIPSINWLIIKTPITAGMMITGSHIAPQLNGIKFFAHEEEVSSKDQEEIEKIYHQIKKKTKISKNVPEVHSEDRARRLYVDLLLSLAEKPYPQWKVALDCANGSQSVVIPELLRQLDLNIIEINCDIQDEFIARDTDTDDKAGIEKLKETVKKEACDFGIAFDGDGDRVVFVDEKGRFVQGEYSCSLVAKESPSDTLVVPISASQVVDSLGKKVERTKVGSPYVIDKMKKTGALFGFESNGGAISAEIMYTRDGGTMALKLLNLFSRFKGSFSEFVGQLPKFYMFRTKIDYKWELQQVILDEAKRKFRGIKIDEQDGLKIWIDETTWMLFRSSQNAPEFRVFAESNKETKAKNLLDEGIGFVGDIIKKHD